MLKKQTFETPLGPMIAIADEQLCFLQFADQKNMASIVLKQVGAPLPEIATGAHPILERLKHELSAYFTGGLFLFELPVLLKGTDFQKSVWNALIKVPYGSLCSYGQQAASIGRPSAYRAVAQANSLNPIAIAVPCHRIIQSDGGVGGYAGGAKRKAWLIQHEQKNCF